VKAHFSDWRADMDLQEKKAKKDYDGDGKIESGTAEYMGSRDKAIKKAMAKEEFIADAKEEDKEDKKLDVMKGKNEIKINPALGESIRAELDALKAKKVEEAMAAAKEAGPSSEEKRQLMNKDRMLKRKIMMQKQTMQMQKQGKLPLNYSEGSECAEGEMNKEMNKNKKKEGEEDPRSMPAKINLAKNKLRAMGLRMSYDMEGEMTEGASNPFQVHFDKDGKEYTSKGTKSAAMKIAKNIASNRKKGPMKYDPYKGTDGRD
jgi:hypothetical protein